MYRGPTVAVVRVCPWSALLGVWLGLGLSVAWGQVNLYVSPDGSDGTNDCRNADAPCLTVGYALSQSSVNGDTLYVGAGVYTESGLTIQSNVTIRGAGATTTILQAASAFASATTRVLWVKSGVTAVVEDVTFRYGHTLPGPAGLAAQGGVGENGGGLYVNGSAFLRRCLIYDNGTGSGGAGADGFNGGRGGHGAGIYCDGILELVECVVSSNRAGSGGPGGVGGSGGAGGDGAALHVSGQALLDRSTIYGNLGGPGGSGAHGGNAGSGALWNGGQLIVRSSTISANAAGLGGTGTDGNGGEGGAGGAIKSLVGSTLILEHSTIAGNSAGTGGAGPTNGGAGFGGGLFAESGTVSMTHSIIAGNQVSPGGQGPDVWGSWISTGYNLVQASNDWSAVGAVMTGLDPLLGGLALQGGCTPTHALPFASPAVNAGDASFSAPPWVDQRGLPRVQGERIDLGAYELANTSLYVAVTGDDAGNDCRLAGNPCATLAHAVQQALPGDLINLGTGLHVAVSVNLDRTLTLVGMGISNSAVQAAASAELASNRMLNVLAGVTVTVQRLTLQHGHAPDGMTPGDEGASGGAIENQGHLRLVDCLVQSNRAGRGADQWAPFGSGGNGGNGGAINNLGWLEISNATLRFNQAGAGGHAGTDSTGGAGGSGGAIYNANDRVVLMERCVVQANQAGPGGTNDVLGGEGGLGGALANSGVLTVREVEWDGNIAGSGGLVEGVVTSVGGAGGALYNSGGPALIERSTFAYNQTGEGSDPGLGGGLYNEAELAIENSTFYGNMASGDGGGMWNSYVLNLRHATVVSNTSAANGGGLFLSSGHITTAGHVLVAGNVAAGSGPDVQGEWTGAGYVLVADSNDWSFVGGSDLTGNMVGAQPQFMSFDGHGGFTRTLRLHGTSPGVDHGDPFFAGPPYTDQRGEARIQGTRIDIGASETMSAGQDRDGDGMADDWEFVYGLDPDDPGLTNALAGPNGDPDQDGQDNLSEYIAQTRPDLTQDYFRISDVRRTNAFEVSYWGATGRLYTLQYLDDFLTSGWSQVSGQVDVPGTGSTHTLQESSLSGHRFYRVEIRLSD